MCKFGTRHMHAWFNWWEEKQFLKWRLWRAPFHLLTPNKRKTRDREMKKNARKLPEPSRYTKPPGFNSLRQELPNDIHSCVVWDFEKADAKQREKRRIHKNFLHLLTLHFKNIMHIWRSVLFFFVTSSEVCSDAGRGLPHTMEKVPFASVDVAASPVSLFLRGSSKNFPFRFGAKWDPLIRFAAFRLSPGFETWTITHQSSKERRISSLFAR